MSGTNLLKTEEDKEAWKKMQERTFVNWCNDRLRGHLRIAKKQIQGLSDLEDGTLLLELLEKLAAPKSVGRYNKNPKQKMQMIANLGLALQFISSELKIKLVNIGPEDILGGNVKLILGLMWTLIGVYQIKFTSKKISTKKAMLTWVDSIIPEYAISNFTTCWNDGRCLCGVVDRIRPGSCPNHQALDPANSLENCKLGMDLAERLLSIPKLIDPEDLSNPNVDELSVMTYLSYFCTPANEILLDWIRKKIPANDIRNLSTDWNNGINLGALGEACFPGICPDWVDMVPTDAINNNERLLGLMKDRLDLETPISAAELADPKVDELIVATYLSQFRNAKLKAHPEEFSLRAPNLPRGGVAIIKEPVTFEVEVSEQTANLRDDIKVSAHGPSADIKVNLKPKGKCGLEAVVVPTEAGSYDVVAMFEDENISGSPFTLPVADPSKCSIFGDVPKEMQVGREEGFVVKAREAGPSTLVCSFDSAPQTSTSSSSSSEVLDCDIEEQDNKQFDVRLTPKSIGKESVHLKWADMDIPLSPFDINISDASKVSVSELPEQGKVGEPVFFKISAPPEFCGQGELKVTPRGPSANYTPLVKKSGDDDEDGDDKGEYIVTFVPWEIGPNRVAVKFGGGDIPNSPFSLNIVAAPNAKTCSASGKGLKKAIVGEKTSFKILSPESGLLEKKDPPGLEVTVKSVSEDVTPSVDDNDDGSYNVQYTPVSPGNYSIAVKFYNEHIPGSPFNLDVVPSADASKCRAYGPALHPNSVHIAGNPLDMFVETKDAGTGDLRVVVTGPDDARPKVFIASDDDDGGGSGVYSIKWDVAEPGRYHAHIWWAEQYIPGSPFKIKVSPGPNAAMVKAYGPGLEPSFVIGKDPSDFTIETKDAGIGTLTIRIHGVKGAFKIQAQPISEAEPRTLKALYDPKEPGDYIIAVRWSKEHVPGSPFKVNIREPPKSKEELEAEEKRKKQKQLEKNRPPQIILSYSGESRLMSVTNANGSQTPPSPHHHSSQQRRSNDETDHAPSPTPLAKVNEKKKRSQQAAGGRGEGGSGPGQSISSIQLSQSDVDNKMSASSAISLPSKGRSPSEALRQQQMAMLRQKGVVPPRGAMVVTGSPIVDAKKKKKKKF